MEREQEITAIPIHETFRVAALLAVVGGVLDAYTYILRGGVFANAQTGNIVLLGVHMADKDYRQALYYVVPIIAFSLGVFITEVLKKYFSSRGFAMYEHWIIAIEVLLLLIIGFIPPSMPEMLRSLSYVPFKSTVSERSKTFLMRLLCVPGTCVQGLRNCFAA